MSRTGATLLSQIKPILLFLFSHLVIDKLISLYALFNRWLFLIPSRVGALNPCVVVIPRLFVLSGRKKLKAGPLAFGHEFAENPLTGRTISPSALIESKKAGLFAGALNAPYEDGPVELPVLGQNEQQHRYTLL